MTVEEKSKVHGLPTEAYVGSDRSLYKINRLKENPIFFTYVRVSREEIKEIIDLPWNNETRNQKSACLEGANHKAAGARTDTGGIYGGDYLH